MNISKIFTGTVTVALSLAVPAGVYQGVPNRSNLNTKGKNHD